MCAIVAMSAVLLLHPALAAMPDGQCFADASSRFGHKNPDLLRALALQESSGKCQSRHPRNRDGSYDIGCMGINSSWLPVLRKKFCITEQDLYEPCTNVHVGAWVLADNVRRHGDNWRAVGAYNARSEHKRRAYAWKISAKLAALK